MTLSSEEIGQVISIASRLDREFLTQSIEGKVAMPLFRPAVIGTATDAVGVASVKIDGDLAPIDAINATGVRLRAGARCLVAFMPPHGIFVAHLLNPQTPWPQLTQVTIVAAGQLASSSTFIDAYATNAGDLAIPAIPGDEILLTASFTWTNNQTVVTSFDWRVAGSLKYVTSGTTTPASEGIGAMRGNANAEATFGKGVGGSVYYTVSDTTDLVDGKVTFRPRIAATAANRGITGSANFPAQYWAQNLGKLRY